MKAYRKTLKVSFALILLLPVLLMGSAAAQDKDEPAAPGGGVAGFIAGDTSSLLYPLPDDRTPDDGDPTNDGGWLLVDFCTAGATGNRPAQPPDCQHNDDDSAYYDLPFTFMFYGTGFNHAYINNNGNLSFNSYYSTFTPYGFPVADYPMVAPFWADVDTGWLPPFYPTLGHVWYKLIDQHTLAVTWDDVGYYYFHDDKRNTFQVVISDGSNPDLGPGNNVCLSFADMQWTTGDESGGNGGFWGTPATVGANKGDGVAFFQIGRFNRPDASYDGPGGADDGVDYLDGQTFCFNALGQNIPPIAEGFPIGDRATVQCGEELQLAVGFIGPELGDTVTVTVADVNNAQAAGLSITSTPGNPATVAMSWLPDEADAGTYELDFTAVDNGVPPETTLRTLYLDVECANQPPTADPNGPYLAAEGGEILFDGTASFDPDGDPLTYDWDFGDGSTGTGPTPVHAYAEAGSYPVCLTVADPAGLSDTECTTAEIAHLALAVSADPASQTVQYGDGVCAVTFTATDVAAGVVSASTEWSQEGEAWTSGMPAGLVLGSPDCVAEGPAQTCTWTLAGAIGEPAGGYQVRVTVYDEGGSSGFAETAVTVEREDAQAGFTENPVAVQVVAPGGDSGPFTVRVELGERLPDQALCGAEAGDIGKALVSMSLAPVGPGSSVAPTGCTATVGGSGYEARQMVACTFDGVAVNSYYLVATVGGSYYAGGSAEDVLVVYDPSLGFTTGGGWFYWPGSEDPGSDYPGDKTNFGYVLKYNRNRNRVQGSVLVIRHLADGAMYRLKSNVLYGLSIGANNYPTFGWASFTGKAAFRYPDGSEHGNHIFTVYAEDWAEPGAGSDRFWAEVTVGGQVIEPMSLPTPAPDTAAILDGGNVVVPH